MWWIELLEEGSGLACTCDGLQTTSSDESWTAGAVSLTSQAATGPLL
jgi:hypothetical protein